MAPDGAKQFIEWNVSFYASSVSYLFMGWKSSLLDKFRVQCYSGPVTNWLTLWLMLARILATVTTLTASGDWLFLNPASDCTIRSVCWRLEKQWTAQRDSNQGSEGSIPSCSSHEGALKLTYRKPHWKIPPGVPPQTDWFPSKWPDWWIINYGSNLFMQLELQEPKGSEDPPNQDGVQKQRGQREGLQAHCLYSKFLEIH